MALLSFQTRVKGSEKEAKVEKKKLRVIDIPLFTPTDVKYSSFDYEEIKRQIGVIFFYFL